MPTRKATIAVASTVIVMDEPIKSLTLRFSIVAYRAGDLAVGIFSDILDGS